MLFVVVKKTTIDGVVSEETTPSSRQNLSKADEDELISLSSSSSSLSFSPSSSSHPNLNNSGNLTLFCNDDEHFAFSFKKSSTINEVLLEVLAYQHNSLRHDIEQLLYQYCLVRKAKQDQPLNPNKTLGDYGIQNNAIVYGMLISFEIMFIHVIALPLSAFPEKVQNKYKSFYEVNENNLGEIDSDDGCDEINDNTIRYDQYYYDYSFSNI